MKTKLLLLTLLAAKRFLFMWVLLLVASQVMAEKVKVLSVDDVIFNSGEQCELVVNMDYDTDETIRGVSFSVYLPKGITPVVERYDDDKKEIFKGKIGEIAPKKLQDLKSLDSDYVRLRVDGSYLVVIIDYDEKVPFSSTHGELIRIGLNVESTVTESSIGQIKDIAVSSIDNVSLDQGNIADVDFNFIVKGSAKFLNVTDENGVDLTDKVNVSWYDVNGNQIGTGKFIYGIKKEAKLYYSVTFGEDLGRIYREVKMQEVLDSDETVTCKLKRIEELTLHGKISYLGEAIPRAEVNLTQWLNGKYDYKSGTKTDGNGEFSLQAYNDSTELLVMADGYTDKIISRQTLANNGEMGAIEMEQVSGKVVSMALSYQESVREGEEPMVQDWYTDTRNIAYTIKNLTKGTDIVDFAIQQGNIVLPTGVESSDRIQVTLRSLNNKFAEASGEGIISAEGMVEIAIRLIAYGGIEAVCNQKADDQLLGMLYDNEGKLVSSSTSSSIRISFSNLLAGNYTLVAMGYNGAIGNIGNLSDLDVFGLVEGSDYIKAPVTVRDGIVGIVDIADIPEVDASKFEYTSLNTSYLPNKNQMSIGSSTSYVTLTARVDFKTQFSNEVDNIKVVADIPEGCEFIANSVVSGTKIPRHTLNGNQLTISLGKEDIDSRIRFCVMPKQTGTFTSTAYAEFDYHGAKCQSIGTAVFEVTAGSISVPSVTDSPTIAISGIAAPHVTVDVYDANHLIATTEALGDGKWRIEAELYKPYNLSTHEIYAKYQMSDGFMATTASKECFYDMNQIKAKTVTMSFYNAYLRKNIEVVFDLEAGTASSNSYQFYTATDFTFIADLTNNDTTVVNDVTIRVYTDKKNWRNLKAYYDAKIDGWVAVSQFGSDELPVGVDVTFNVLSKEIVQDRKYLTELLGLTDVSISNTSKEIENISSILASESYMELSGMYDELYSILSGDVIDVDKLEDLLGKVMDTGKETDYDEELLDEEINKFYLKDEVLEQEYENSLDSICNSYFINSELKDFILPTNSFSTQLDNDDYKGTYKIEQLNGIDTEQLILNGYNRCSLTDNTDVYFKFANDEISFVDAKTNIKYTLNLERETIVNNSRRRISSTFDFENFAYCLSTIKDGTSTLRNFSSNTIDAKSECQRVIDVLSLISDGISCFYMSTYGQLQKMLNDVHAQDMAKTNAEIKSLEDLSGDINSRIAKNEREIGNLSKVQKGIEENCNALSELMNSPTISESERIYYQNEFNKLDNQWKANNVKINALKKSVDSDLKAHQKIIERIGKLNLQKLAKEEGFINGTSKLWRMPARLTRGAVTINKTVSTLGKLAGPLGVLIEAWSLFCDLDEGINEINEWKELIERAQRYFPCENDSAKLERICNDINSDTKKVIGHVLSIFIVESDALVLDIASLRGFNIYVWLISGYLNGYGEISKNFILGDYIQKRGKYYVELMNLKCTKEKCPRCGKNPCVCKDKCPRCGNKPCTCPDKCPKCGNNPCICEPPYPRIPPIHDPSGFVYEAVPTNRLEGVTATIFFEQSNPTKWDAADFSQVNPQVTDESGLYQWDVPQGMWQVRFEKDGYETTQTDWLPVPPPQLEINIPMYQAVAPSVVKASGMESGITLDFSKYMKPATLEINGRVSATVNGKEASGGVEMLNLEEDPYNNKEFASKVKFVPSTAFKTSDEVVITVKKEVESYANKRMAADFVQRVKIESEINGFDCDSLFAVDYQGEGVLEIAVVPANAAKGRTININTTSPLIATVDKQSVILNEEGKATVNVSGNLPGSASLHLTLDGTDIEKYVDVNVVMHETVVKTPKASKRSGSIIDSGYLLWLSCNTPGATIYYTLDGSCPCDEATRIKYTEPFKLPIGQVTLKTVAVRQGMEESDVATFTYTVRPDGDANCDNSVDVADIAMIISFMAGQNEIDKRLVDVNLDGTVDVADIAAVIDIMAHK